VISCELGISIFGLVVFTREEKYSDEIKD